MQQDPAGQRRHCPNCGHPIAEGGMYCSECGQKYTTGKVAVWELVRDLFESVFNIDSKIFRTLGALFIPGKLTVEYFKGRHRRYVPPLRLFLVMAFLFFAVLGIMLSEKLEPMVEEIADSQQSDAYRAVFMEAFDSIRQSVEQEFAETPRLGIALDTIENRLHGTRQDSMFIGYLDFQSGGTLEGRELTIAKRDLVGLSLDELCDRYEVHGFINRLQIKQFLKVNMEGGNFTRFVISNALWMVLLMMPALALILKLLYIRRNRYYVEHLIFSFHYHAFSFLLIAVGILVGSDFMIEVDEGGVDANLFDGDVITTIVYVLIFLYLFLAMRRVYGQGYLKTFLKFGILNIAYIFVFVLFLTAFFIISALIF